MRKSIAAMSITLPIVCLLAWWATSDNEQVAQPNEYTKTASTVEPDIDKPGSPTEADERLIATLAAKLASRTHPGSAVESESMERTDSGSPVTRRPIVIVTGRDRAIRNEVRIPRADAGMVKPMPGKLAQQRSAHDTASMYESLQQMRATRSIVVVGSRTR